MLSPLFLSGGNFVGYIVFFRRHVVPLENLYFSSFPKDSVCKSRPRNPTGPVLTTSLALVGLTIRRLIPRTAQSPQALQVSEFTSLSEKEELSVL